MLGMIDNRGCVYSVHQPRLCFCAAASTGVPMPLITSADAPTFRLDDLEVVGFAAPSRGASELSMWRLTLAAGAVGVAHSMDREEVFVALAGEAEVVVGAARYELRA